MRETACIRLLLVLNFAVLINRMPCSFSLSPYLIFLLIYFLLCAHLVPGTGRINFWDLIKVLEITKVLLSTSYFLTSLKTWSEMPPSLHCGMRSSCQVVKWPKYMTCCLVLSVVWLVVLFGGFCFFLTSLFFFPFINM